MKKNILIADLQFLTRKALEMVVSLTHSVSGIAVSKKELVELLNLAHPDLLIMDYNLFGIDYIKELTELRSNYPLLLMLLIVNEINYTEIKNLASIGIKNIILKTADKEELNTAINFIINGKNYYSQDILNIALAKINEDNVKEEDIHLTSTEIEIVRLITKGMTAKEIASYKNISFHTVMTHRKNIFRKTGVTNVSELMMYAIKKGWIDNIEYYI